jgi:predicted transcriptional regulator YdeE
MENHALLLAGCFIKYEGGNDWVKWEEMDQKAADDKRYEHHCLINGHQAHSVYFYPESGIHAFTGLEVTEKADDTAWEYMEFPAVTYAVFDLDYKIDQGPQYAAIDEWVKNNADKYARFEWDAGGLLDKCGFAVYIYDHGGKFRDGNIVEMWLPLRAL